jgi:arylsulfatase A-like enzyme
LGIDDQTLVIFTSDNGALPTFKGSRSAGLRGSKLSLYEGGIRMPFLVRWPGHTPADRVDADTVIAGVDLFPTLCRIAGAELPPKQNFDGQDMTEALRGNTIERQKPLFWEYGRNNEFFRYPANAHDRSPNVAVRDRSWKLLVNAASNEGDNRATELYDLAADPKETTNLADQHPDIARRLSTLALEWRGQLP